MTSPSQIFLRTVKVAGSTPARPIKMMNEMNIYEDLRKDRGILESTYLSEDYLNEINSIIISLQEVQDMHDKEKQELEKIINQDMPSYEEHYLQRYQKHPEFGRIFISFAKSKPEFLNRLNKAVEQYNTFSKSTRLVESFQRMFLDYFKSIIRGEKYGVIKP